MAYQPHGVQNEQVVNSRHYLRDTRHPTQRFWDFTGQPSNLAVCCLTAAGLLLIYPALTDFGLILAVTVLWRASGIAQRLPLKLPDHCQRLDRNDPVPGDRGQVHRARGVFFLGNERKSLKQLWESFNDVLTHVLVIGGTGSGKTEAMLSMASNTLLWGSGFAYTDGKGDSALWTKAFALARACGREDDLYVINYMTASTTIDPDAPVEQRLSNQFNPYLQGSADALIQLTASLLSETSGDSANWREKAIGLLTVIAQVVVVLRERGLDEHGEPFVLDVGSLRRYFSLDRLINVYLRARHRVEGFTLNDTAFQALQHYLDAVPGYQDPQRLWEANNKTNEPFNEAVIREQRYPTQPESQAYIQHGYLQNQFTRAFSQLSEVYGHIYRCHYGEVDFHDIVVNRRILVVMLPALEKSPDELAALGKIIIAAKKTMLAVGLGARLEGAHKDVIDNKPIHSPSPFMDFNDEYGYYAVKGFAIVPAQARSIGFSVVFGGQDTPSFGKESKEEAQAVFGNTLTKIAMRIEDAGESFELFQKTAGEALVTQTSGFTRHDNAWLSNYYHDNAAAGVERRNRIDLRDIRDQREGQAHVFYGSEIIRANLYFAEIPTAREYRINRFVQVLPLTADQIQDSQDTLSSESLGHGVQAILRTSNSLLNLISRPERLQEARAQGGNVRFAQHLVQVVAQTYERYESGLVAAIEDAAGRGASEGGDRAQGESADQPGRSVTEAQEAVVFHEDDLLMTGLCQDIEMFDPDERATGQDNDDISDTDSEDDVMIDAVLPLSLHEASSTLAARLGVLGQDDPFMLAALMNRMLRGQLPASVSALVWPPPETETLHSPIPPTGPAVVLGDPIDTETAWHGLTGRTQTGAVASQTLLHQMPDPLAQRPLRQRRSQPSNSTQRTPRDA